jgi:hypothetical protein
MRKRRRVALVGIALSFVLAGTLHAATLFGSPSRDVIRRRRRPTSSTGSPETIGSKAHGEAAGLFYSLNRISNVDTLGWKFSFCNHALNGNNASSGPGNDVRDARFRSGRRERSELHELCNGAAVPQHSAALAQQHRVRALGQQSLDCGASGMKSMGAPERHSGTHAVPSVRAALDRCAPTPSKHLGSGG